jgi:hypothetical protein
MRQHLKLKHFFSGLQYYHQFLVVIIYLIIIMCKKIMKWFELNLGWFFVNGRKQEMYVEYLKNKYLK